MNSVLVTYIYPSVQPYLKELIDCINKQTADKFEIIFFNDGLNNLEDYFSDKVIGHQYHIFNLSGTISEIRFKSFRILSELNYDNIIFQDADDGMTNNRIDEMIGYLKSYQVVVNDIDLIGVDGSNINKNFWSERLSHETTFDRNFLLDKNIAGLGNTSIKRELLTLPFRESNSVIAVDWFVFYQLLNLSNSKGIFINSARTLYRQHELNTVGLSQVNETRIKEAKEVKEVHYKELNRIGYDFDLQLRNLKKSDIINTGITNNKKSHFWWEETEYLQ